MFDDVHVYYVFEGSLTSDIIEGVLSFCAEEAQFGTDSVGEDVEGWAVKLVEEGGWVEVNYGSVFFDLSVLEEERDLLNIDFPTIRLKVDEIYFRPRPDLNTEKGVIEHSSQLAEFVAGLYEHLAAADATPKVVYVLGPDDSALLTEPGSEHAISEAALLDDEFEYVSSWLQILPPAGRSASRTCIASTWRSNRSHSPYSPDSQNLPEIDHPGPRNRLSSAVLWAP